MMSAESPPRSLPLAGKVAVITGSSGGIGQATARRMMQQGASVLLHANRNADSVRNLLRQQEATDFSPNARIITGNLSENGFRESFLEQSWEWKGRVDILIHAAGVDLMAKDMRKRSFEEKLAALWELDVQTTIQLSRQFGERMRRQSFGVILTIGWDGAERGMAGDTSQLYAAAKGAVIAFSRSLAHSLAPEVRVNCVSPGWIRTRWGENAPTRMQNKAIRDSLQKRWGRAEEIADVLTFLASDEAAFLNAQNLLVNGGFDGEG